MRLAPLVVLAALVAAPTAGAHEEDAESHFNLRVQDLEPGESHEIHATFERGLLEEGWVFIMVGTAISENSTLHGRLSLDNETVHEFEWAGDQQVQLESLALPETARVYNITLTNPGPDPIRYAFYFDQSCDCAGKPVMPFPGAWYVFNFDFYEGETVWLTMDKPPATDVEFDVVTRNGEGGTYPDDFTTLLRYPADALPNGTVTWDVPEDGTYYLFARAAAGKGDAGQMLVPQIRISHQDSDTQGFPIPGAGVVVGLVAVAALAMLVSRRQ